MAERLPDLYALLGVPPDATDEEIRRAYRKLAREHHPDVSADPEGERRFKEISAAYRTLSDPAKRRQYDLFGSGQMAADQFPFGDLTELFEAFFGGTIGRRRGSGPRRDRARRGEDLFVTVDLAFEEAAFGVEREVVVESLEVCPRCSGNGCEPGTHPSRCGRCGGTGEIQDVARSVFGTVMTARTCGVCDGSGQEIAAPCTGCSGEGRIPKGQRVTIEVPAGVSDGMELRVAGGGAAGRHQGVTGDLYVALRIEPHPVFERRGQDLVCALELPLTQALLGTEVEIDTLDGSERLRLEPGTTPGTVVRLKGRGVPNLGRRGRGDLFVTVQVDVPKTLSKKERELVERLAELRGEAPEKGKRGKGLLGKLTGP
jgi:molecular chaperone DnaJ